MAVNLIDSHILTATKFTAGFCGSQFDVRTHIDCHKVQGPGAATVPWRLGAPLPGWHNGVMAVTSSTRVLTAPLALVGSLVLGLSACSTETEPVALAADLAAPATEAPTPTTAAPVTTVPPPATTAAPVTTTATTTSTTSTTTTTLARQLTTPIPPPQDADAAEPVIEMGRIAIPKIDVDSVMYEGIRNTTLDYGPGHWPGSAVPGQIGNVVVAGHRTSKHRVFRNVDQLVEGDPIIFTGADGSEHVYRVTKVEIVGPEALWIVDPTDTPTVTLFACHPPGSTAQRIVVYADLEI